MEAAIIVSAGDPAGQTIKSVLQQMSFSETAEQYDGYRILRRGNTKLYTTVKESIHFEECDTISADFLIFSTKHVSTKGVPSLCTHAIGNWGTAEMGGREKTLGIAPAPYLKRALQLLEEKNLLGFDVFQEATHHGPASQKPILFIEIGSSQKEYENREAGFIIANTLLDILSFKPLAEKTAVGIGGLHHSPNFKKIQLNSNIAVGHICPKYNLPFLTKEMVVQAIDRTSPKAELIILDWKGLGENKERIKQLVDEVAHEKEVHIMRTQEF